MGLKEFIDFIAEENRPPTHTGKVLGITWNCDNDTLVVPGPHMSSWKQHPQNVRFYKSLHPYLIHSDTTPLPF